MRSWIYGVLLGYVAITTAAAFWFRWSGAPGQRFLASLGEMLPGVMLWVSGSAGLWLYLVVRWLTVALVMHRLCRCAYFRRFELPFGFDKGWAVVAAIGECLLLLAVMLHLASGMLNSQGLGALSLAPYGAAALILPSTFVLVELWSLRGYRRRKLR